MDVDAVEHVGDLGPIDLGAPHPEGLHPGPLHELEHLVAVQLAHGVAEDGAEQPDIGAHRLGRLAAYPGSLHSTDRCQRVGNLNHEFQYRVGSRGPPGE